MKQRIALVTSVVLMLIGGVAVLAFTPSVSETASGSNGDTNQVEYWCPSGGEKFDPASTPFVVPAPPEGKVWTLLVLKAGSEESTDEPNQQFPNPVVGQSYSRTDGKQISHAILCYGTATTTTSSSTTSTSTTSTSSTTTTSTTLPPQSGLFAIDVFTECVEGFDAVIHITFGVRPDLDGQSGELYFTNTATGAVVGTVALTFVSNASVIIPYPDTTADVTLTYVLGDEEEVRTVEFPPECPPDDDGGTTTTTTTIPGGTTTTTVPGQTTTTTVPGQTTTTVPGNPGTTPTTTVGPGLPITH